MVEEISCIYQIRNLANGKVYIGSTGNLRRRKREHLYKLSKNLHHNPHLQNAYNKYGSDNFVVEMLEQCFGEKELENRELHWWKTVKDKGLAYNLKVPETRYGGKLSRETKDKISKTMLKVKPFEGRTHTDEAKQKMSAARRDEKSVNWGKLGKFHPAYGSRRTKEWKTLRSEQYSGNGNPNYGVHGKNNKLSKPVIQIDRNTGEIIKLWNSVAEASEGVGAYASNISRCARNVKNYRTANGFKWKYL